MKTYQINEVFYSIQGEGVRAGTANVFVRFSGCNLTCTRDGEAGFDCDTEFTSGRKMTLKELWSAVLHAVEAVITQEPRSAAWLGRPGIQTEPWIILTGGEPALQVDAAMVKWAHDVGIRLAIETNGTIALPPGIDWITVSPKTAEHTLKQLVANEVKYVRHYGQGIPRPAVKAEHKLLSPAFVARGERDGVTLWEPDLKAMEWCIRLVEENPGWRLSTQSHKAWRVR
ncbi:MAG: hypothetical protein A3J75_05000 [Acidobacteria bacterium RBG_16_68_9]|nr:MAG: hypothetical protein A3J75_05000 [Acidobacteria bacterium RBG_16_68_9]